MTPIRDATSLPGGPAPSDLLSAPSCVRSGRNPHEVATQFEALLLKNMVESMRKTTMPEDEQSGGQLVEQLIDDALAGHLPKSAGIGLASFHHGVGVAQDVLVLVDRVLLQTQRRELGEASVCKAGLHDQLEPLRHVGRGEQLGELFVDALRRDDRQALAHPSDRLPSTALPRLRIVPRNAGDDRVERWRDRRARRECRR